jgi:hypothetical protein
MIKQNYLSMTGKRAIDTAQQIRLLNAIKSSPQHEKIADEIAWSVRFGSLAKGKQGNDLEISHSLSIAIKLVRQGRWCTPANYSQKRII